ncbi:hypothetical protein DV452_000815 [Geotrichum candidum]|nr:hypothetical protein DV454_000854 [Geotrichum candidum]KAF5121454.1 hypothetical protein DV452_000815 [Geotrichum candidum]KAI8135318.1 hypothetical protein DUD61_001052 [Geotrichum candidum]KAI9210773.1 hypothetical protein DS838_004359 [Geotrichum bryndzae]
MPSSKPLLSFFLGNLGLINNTTTTTTTKPAAAPVRAPTPPLVKPPTPTAAQPILTHLQQSQQQQQQQPQPQQQQQQQQASSARDIPDPNHRSLSTSPGGDKWWIGRLAPDGSEKYYKIEPL